NTRIWRRLFFSAGSSGRYIPHPSSPDHLPGRGAVVPPQPGRKFAQQGVAPGHLPGITLVFPQRRIHHRAQVMGIHPVKGERRQQLGAVGQALGPQQVGACVLKAPGPARPDDPLPDLAVLAAQPAFHLVLSDPAARAHGPGLPDRFTCRHVLFTSLFPASTRGRPRLLGGRPCAASVYLPAASSAAAMRAAVRSSWRWLCSSTSATARGTSTSTPRRIL